MTTQTLDKVESVETEKTGFEFNKLHRCDACGAQAYVRVEKDNKDLIFCVHHSRQFEATFITGGWTIDDQSSILEEEVRKYNTVSDDNF